MQYDNDGRLVDADRAGGPGARLDEGGRAGSAESSPESTTSRPRVQQFLGRHLLLTTLLEALSAVCVDGPDSREDSYLRGMNAGIRLAVARVSSVLDQIEEMYNG